MSKPPQKTFPIKQLLGASEAISVQQVGIYIPDRDRNNEIVANIDTWIEAALKVFSRFGGGATAVPGLLGVYLNQKSKVLIRENTVYIYTYVIPESFEAHAPALREFVHTFGQATNQAEVAVFWDETLYRVTDYSPTPPAPPAAT